MPSALQEVFARFSIDFDPDRSLDRGQARVDGLADTLRGAVAAFTGSLVVSHVRDFVRETVQVASAIDDTSQVLGISARELQEWQHVARLSGAEVQDFTGSFVRLQDRMQAGGPGLAVFRRLGVDVRDANGGLRNASDVLMDLADPIASIGSDAERTGVLIDLLGRSGARLGPLFSRGREGVAGVRAELARLGGGLSDQAITQAAELGDAWDRLDTIALSLRGALAVYLLPPLQWVSDEIAGLTEDTHFLERALQSATVVTIALGAATISTWGPIAATALAAIAPWVLLGLAVEDLIVLFRGGHSLIGDVMDELGGDGTQEAFVESMTAAWETLNSRIQSAGEGLRDFLGLGETEVGGFTESGDARLATRGLDRSRAITAESDRQRDINAATIERFNPYFLNGDRLAGAMQATENNVGYLGRTAVANATTTIDRSIRIERIDASGLTPAQAEAVVSRAVRAELDRQGDDALDALAGGAVE